MTCKQLELAIAQLREPNPRVPKIGTHFVGSQSEKRNWTWHSREWEWLPRCFTSDAYLILELLQELFMPQLSQDWEADGLWQVLWWIDAEHNEVGPYVDSPGKAVALAWYQWKTGVRVELCEATP